MVKQSEKVNDQIYESKINICRMLIDWFYQNGCAINKCLKIEFDATTSPFYEPKDNSISIQQHKYDSDYPIYIFQLAHELTHTYISFAYLANKIRWIDELIASNMSYYALEYFREFYPELAPDIDKCIAELLLPSFPKNTFEDARQIIIEYIDELEANPRLVYLPNVSCSGLSRVLYDNKQRLNIWELINFFKEFAIPYTCYQLNDGLLYNSNIEHFNSVNYQSLLEPLAETNLQFFISLLTP